MKHLFTFWVFLLSFNLIIAQKEYHKWYFGSQAAMDFLPGAPVTIANSAMPSTDNPASISDSLGNILFYSNGLQVWNKNHVVMANGTGLLGDNSGGHTATAVKQPGSSSIYYLFTMDNVAGSNGLRYSIIDMTLNSGLGGVVVGQKNVLLLTPASEQIVPVVHSNGSDIWIVTHPWNSSSFHSYLINCSGLNTTPVISTVGSARNGNTNAAQGQINVNAANDRIATTNWSNSTMELFNFDNSTGLLSNALLFTGLNQPWAVEFSPNGSKLYLSGWTTQYVTQYDLTTYTQSAIAASAVNLGNVTGPGAPYFTGYMQRAPDGKIYIAVYLDPFLAVINNPDASGLACNLVDNGFNLGGRTSGAGLPDKVVATYTTTVTIGNDTTYCGSFTRTLSTGNANTLWSTGVTASQITVTTPGTYWASIISGCGSGASDTIRILQNTSPIVNLGNDTALCTGQTATLNAGNAGSTYIWQDNSANATYNVSTAGSYAVTVTNASGCSASDAINVTYTTGPPPINLGNDTAYCGTFTRVLSTGNAATAWSTGATASQITVTTPGTYTATLSNGCGTSSDNIVLTQNTSPIVNLGNDTALCTGQTATLNAGNAGSTYIWQDNSTNATFAVSAAGNYAVTVTNASGCSASDAINVTYTTGPPTINLGNDTAYCGTFTRVLSTGNAATAWSTGATASQITVTTPGTYTATLSNGCGSTTDNIVLTQNTIPLVNLGNDTALCTGQTATLNAGNAGSTYIWQDNSTNATFAVSAAGNYAVTVTNASGCSATDAINVSYQSPPQPVNIGNDTAFCGSFTFVLTTGDATTVWSNGLTAGQITVTSPGTYTATITNGCGSVNDAITLTQNQIPVVNLGNDTTLCLGQTVVLDAGNPGATFQWQDNSTAGNFTVSAAGSYSVTVTSASACTASDVIAVTYVAGPPVINLGNDTTYCGNFTRTLDAGSANTLWNTGVTAQQIAANGAGVYWAQQTNACGTTRDSVQFTQLPVPSVFAGNDTSICNGQTVQLTAASSASNFIWNDGSTNSSINVSTVGVYWVEVTTAGCTNRDSVVITAGLVPAFSLGFDTTVCGDELTLIVRAGNAQYQWQDLTTDSFYRITSAGVYSVTVTNACGSATDEVFVNLQPDRCALLVPTGFSPNNDGANDIFRAISRCPVTKYSMHVYNRWGEQVFETDDVTEGWNGVFRDRPQPLSVYVYYIDYFNYCEQKMKKVVGNVTLVR